MEFFGCGRKLEKMQFIGKYFCLNCNRFENYFVTKEKFRITIFFIPIFSITKHYYILCDACHIGNEINETYAISLCNEHIDMFTPMKLDQIMNDTITILKQGTIYEPDMVLERIRQLYNLSLENFYIQNFIVSICEFYGDKKYG